MNSTQRLKITQYWYFALTIFVSAFLLFQVQPLISKYILPWFGGGTIVWTTSQAFFQVLLLGGYGYAHAVSRMNVKTQTRLHVALLAVAIVWGVAMTAQWGTPITPGINWRPSPGVVPVWQVLLVLLVSVGLPYFLLSTTSSLIQAWFSRVYALQSPYSFYILSNFASLFALLSYPVIFEPNLTVHQQALLWSGGFVLFVASLCLTAWRVYAKTKTDETQYEEELLPEEIQTEQPAKKPTMGNYLLWINLAACATVMSLATTNQLTQDIASVPFLWVLPLSLYLISFIIAFNDRIKISRGIMVFFMLDALAFGLIILLTPGSLELGLGITLNAFVLLVVCVFCHTELYRRRPDPRYLTSFYLMLSIGGAFGGILVSFVAPLLFKGFWEYPLGLLFCADLLVSMIYEQKNTSLYRYRIVLAVITGVLAVGIVVMPLETYSASLMAQRNFYGVVRVRETDFDGVPAYTLVNGAIIHGIEATKDQEKYRFTSYYTETSGVGLAILQNPKRQSGQPLRIGVIGLGVGTITEYGLPGDVVRFYEIDPKVIDIAYNTPYFTYLRDAKAKVEIVEGDARLSMERELKESGSERYDVLIIDAFSGDSIPTHLLSKEAIQLYLNHLNPSGVMVFHISNKYLNLEPVLTRARDALGLQGTYIGGKAKGPLDFPSFWVMLAPDRVVINNVKANSNVTRDLQSKDSVRLWTDDYSNLFQVIR